MVLEQPPNEGCALSVELLVLRSLFRNNAPIASAHTYLDVRCDSLALFDLGT